MGGWEEGEGVGGGGRGVGGGEELGEWRGVIGGGGEGGGGGRGGKWRGWWEEGEGGGEEGCWETRTGRDRICSQRASNASERCPPADPQPGGDSGTRAFSLNCLDSARSCLCLPPSP